MTPPAHFRHASGEARAPIARIEAQDREFCEPLREYLARFGCEVVVNTDLHDEPAYVICVGDAEFVKDFFGQRPFESAKKLAVIYEGGEEGLSVLRSRHVKYFLIDPVPLTEQLTHDIFSLFFSSQEAFKSNRKGRARIKREGVIPQQAPREQALVHEGTSADDKKRIADAMNQIFNKQSSEKNEKLYSKKLSRVGRWILAPVVLFLLPAFTYVLAMALGIGLLVAGSKTLMAGNYSLTSALVQNSTTYLRSAQTMLHLVSPVLAGIGMRGIAEDQDRLVSVFLDITRTESSAIAMLTASKRIAAGILVPDDTAAPIGVSDVMQLTAEVRRVSQLLGLITAEMNSLMDSGRYPFRTRFVSGYIEQGLAELGRVREVVGYTEKLLTMYPRIGGFRKKQTYLVLLQNSMELRPTGGFIGSLLLITFADGKVEQMEVQDVYTVDGQLKGHIDPPQPIREILGQEHWYLRDSNWDPDFTESGKQAAWFYEKETGKRPDGVIAISLPMLTKLLRITGPIELIDFNDRISESNFYAKSLLYTQTDFFPGSTQKKDFLGALISAILGRLTSDNTIAAGKLLDITTQSVQSRDIQFYFTDPELEKLVDQWGWTGSIAVDECNQITPDVPCIGDGIGIVGANLGVNKVNFFIRQEAVSDVAITDDGSIEHTLTLTVENISSVQSDGSNVYQTYMRVIVPRGTELRGITIDGQDAIARDVKNPVPPPSPYYIYEDGESASLIHLSYAVSPRQTRQMVFRLSRPNAVRFDTSGMYQFRIRKQPGVDGLPWHVAFTYPEQWTAVTSGGFANPGRLEYNTDLTKDGTYTVMFQKTL